MRRHDLKIRPHIYIYIYTHTSFISKSCFLSVVSKKIMSKQKFSVEVLHLVWKFDEDRIYNEKKIDTRFYIWKPIFNFTWIGGTSENIKIDCINYILTKFGAITICMILLLTAALRGLRIRLSKNVVFPASILSFHTFVKYVFKMYEWDMIENCRQRWPI